MGEEENGTKPKVNGAESLHPEASETDPCMDDAIKGFKPAGRFPLLDRYRDRVTEITGLSPKFVVPTGVIVLLLLFMTVTVIALAIAWPRSPHRHNYPVCKRRECLEAAAQIREGLDDSYTVCSDVWNWTCGGWIKSNPLPKDRSTWNQKQQLLKQDAARVRDLIATLKLPLYPNTVEWKLKHLYEACMDVDNVKIDEARPLLTIIHELGGWYILKDWSDYDFDYKPILTQLLIRYGVSPYFKITVEAHPHVPGTSCIVIAPSGLGLPGKEYYFSDNEARIQTAYKELIRDVVINLSSTRNEAEKFGKDMFYYEKRIAEITPALHSMNNPIASYNSFILSALQDQINNIPFFDIISAMYPESGVSDKTEVYVTSIDYLTEVARIIATSDKTTINSYLIWTLVRSYLPYLHEKMTSALDIYNAELLGVNEPLERWEFCSNLAQKTMGYAINVLSERNNPISRETITVVTNIFNTTKNTLLKKLQNTPNKQLQGYLSSKLENVQLQIGLPNKVKNETALKSFYTKLQIIKSTLFTSVVHSKEFAKKLEQQFLLNPDYYTTTLTKKTHSDEAVSYKPELNTVLIPQTILQEPAFNSKYPRSVLFGRIGVEIANALLSAVLPYDSFWTSDRKLLSSFHKTVNDSVEMINDSHTCLNKYIIDYNLVETKDVSEETALHTLKQLTAVRLANEALRDWLLDREHVHQPTLEEFEDSALFFLSYAQTQCAETTRQQQLFDNTIRFQLSQKSELLLFWTQLDEFAKSFDCSFDVKSKCRDILF